jgi:hypothetical protein
LKAFFQTDSRGIEEILEDLPELRAADELDEVPHFTTWQKAERRLLDMESTQKLLQETIKAALSREQMDVGHRLRVQLTGTEVERGYIEFMKMA